MNIFIVFFALISIAGMYFFSLGRKYISSKTVASSYDSWTNDRLLENLWGEHIHLGYYQYKNIKKDFKQAKIDFVHQLVVWSGLNNLPKGSRIIDIGCGIGGSSRILAKDYGFDVVGVSISSEQIRRAIELTPKGLNCEFLVMDALDLNFEKGSFDGVWSVEAGPHMFDKQRYADEMLRVLRPGGVLAVADWNRRDPEDGEMNRLEKIIMHQLLTQWTHPEFSSIKSFKKNLLKSRFCGGSVETEDWTLKTIRSWNESIYEGFRRPGLILRLGYKAFFKAIREIPTILMMRWAFGTGLMNFGVFKSRG